MSSCLRSAAWSLAGRLLAVAAAAVAAMAAHSNRLFPDIRPCYQNPSICLLQPFRQLEVLGKRADQRSHPGPGRNHVWRDAEGLQCVRAHGTDGGDDRVGVQRVCELAGQATIVGNAKQVTALNLA